MKYKIKVKVMQDGSSRYYPMVKKHWWMPWMYLRKLGFTSFTPHVFCKAKEQAEDYILDFKADLLDHTYNIPYKEDE